jgi:muramoyltetrapeptide carboxypeptidase
MPINFTKNKEATDTLFKFLEGQMMSYAYPISNPANRSLFVEGKATAPIIGGNLSLLYAMQGSITDIDTSGKILFIEDLDEYLYHIDRMIVSLKRAGKFEAIAGLIVGGMSDMKDNTVPFGKTAEQIIASHIKDAKFPVCYDFPCGHIDRNLSLPLGLTATLLVEHNQVSLTYTA